jgi:membrane peptidoglycan carboxypeptidase
MLSLVEAARRIGLTTLAKAIKSGKLSVNRKEDGSYEIDPAELAQLYAFSPPGETTVPARALRHL